MQQYKYGDQVTPAHINKLSSFRFTLKPLKELGVKEGDLIVSVDREINSLHYGEVVRVRADTLFDLSRVAYNSSGSPHAFECCINAFAPLSALGTKPKPYSYSKTYKRDDGTTFEKDTIDGIKLEELKNREAYHYAEARGIRALLNAHSKLTF